MPVPVQKRDETRFNFPVTFPHMSTHTWVLVLWSSTTSHYSQQSTSPLVLAGIQVSAPPRSAGYKLRARKVSRKIDSLSSLLTTTPLQRLRAQLPTCSSCRVAAVNNWMMLCPRYSDGWQFNARLSLLTGDYATSTFVHNFLPAVLI